MKEKQLITINPDGSVFGLDFKRKGINLRKLGHCAKKRISDIEFDEHYQKHFVCIRENDLGVPAGKLDVKTWEAEFGKGAGGPSWSTLELKNREDAAFLFEDYEDAVTAEVNFIQAVWKRKGGKA